jgi:hypothetical protein
MWLQLGFDKQVLRMTVVDWSLCNRNIKRNVYYFAMGHGYLLPNPLSLTHTHTHTIHDNVFYLTALELRPLN